MDVLIHTKHRSWSSHVIDVTFPVSEGTSGYLKKLLEVCDEADKASQTNQIIILSDRKGSADRIPISSLVALGEYAWIFFLLKL